MRISDWSSDVCSSDLQPNSRRCRKQLAWAGPTSPPAAMPMLPTANSKVSLHSWDSRRRLPSLPAARLSPGRSEEHTSELQVTNAHLVCRLLLEKKKNKKHYTKIIETYNDTTDN